MDKPLHRLRDASSVNREALTEVLRVLIQDSPFFREALSEERKPSRALLDFIFVKGNDRFYYRVSVAEIVYVKAEGSKVAFRVKAAERSSEELREYIFYCSLSDFLHQCKHPDLLRVHRSYVVNVQQVIARNERELKLSNGAIIPLSQTYHSSVNKRLPLLRSQ